MTMGTTGMDSSRTTVGVEEEGRTGATEIEVTRTTRVSVLQEELEVVQQQGDT